MERASEWGESDWAIDRVRARLKCRAERIIMVHDSIDLILERVWYVWNDDD